MNIKNTMIKRIILLKLVLCNIVFYSNAQDTIPFSISKLYGFENIDKDTISNSKVLDKVFEELYLTKQLSKKTIFFHLGDSHLQADYISHTIRTELHKKIGNAGRGLITPLKIAKTNEPFNYLTESKNNWKRQFIISKKINQPVGITGLSILSKDTIGTIKIKTFNTDSIDYSYNTIRVYNEPDSSFAISISDSLNEWQNVNNLNSELTFNSIKSQNTVFLNFTKTSLNQNKVLIYGFSVENNQPGILYHSTGINGAKYSDYNKPTLFTSQIKKLDPNLIILSLGTNESFLPDYDSTTFYLTIDSLVNKIKAEMPRVNLILTTPACSYKYNKKNLNLTSVSKTIVKYAIKNHLPYWDLFEITGGENSAINWKKNLLLSRDGVHYTKQGYILQGQLFVLAFLKGYNQYVKHRFQ
jgi:lysophospholipase L1-like esterase